MTLTAQEWEALFSDFYDQAVALQNERDCLRETNAELLEALRSIEAISVPGPHTSAKDGMRTAFDALDGVRKAARDALAKAKS